MSKTLEALYLVLGERSRQINHHGYTEDIDDKYVNGELAQASTAYHVTNDDEIGDTASQFWPSNWDQEGFKPSSNPIVNATKAAALALAELERLLRKEEN